MSKLRVRIGILSIALLSMCGIVITPVFSEIIQAFPKVPATTIQMIGSLSSLGQLIISLVVGRLAMSIPKKRLVLIGVTSVIIGGIVPIFWHSQIAILLVCAFVVGIGVGFVSTLTPILISIFFKGEARASMMGFNMAFNSLGAVLMMSAAGILGSKMWFHSYYVFLLAVLVFFLVLFMLPLDKVEKVNINSSSNQFHLNSTDLLDHTTYNWQVRVTDNHRTVSPWSSKMVFTTELKHWNAKWIEPKQDNISEEAPLDLAAMFGGKPMPKQTSPEQRLRPVQYLHKNFKLHKPVKKAQLFMTAHGIYYPMINGQRVTQAQFMPDFTSYKNILQYQYFDITKFLGTVNNWTVVLADGWYSSRISTTGNGGQFGDKNGILGEIIITYADKTQDIIKTDRDFKSTTGKYIYSDIFIGKKQNLNQEPDWNNAQNVDEVSYSLDNLIPQDAQYVHELPAISAKKIWRDEDAILVDFGQVIAGKIKLSTYLGTGVSVKIEHSEVLDKDGHFFNNITGRNKDQTDYFVDRGDFETLTPDFTFHGFRYIKITGLTQAPSLDCRKYWWIIAN